MAHAEGNVTIQRPVKDVFAFILEGSNNPLWRAGVLDIKRVAGSPDGVGAAYAQGMKGPTGRIDADYRIVELVPGSRIKFQVTAGPARPQGTYTFQPAGGGTTVTFSLDFQPKGLARLMNGMIEKQMQVEVGALARLKEYLEAKR